MHIRHFQKQNTWSDPTHLFCSTERNNRSAHLNCALYLLSLFQSLQRFLSVRKLRFLFPPPLSVTISDCLCCFASLSNRAALQSRSSTNSQTWKHTQIHHYDTFVCLKGHVRMQLLLFHVLCRNGKFLLSATVHKPLFHC